MGLCWSTQNELLKIPEPPTGLRDTPPPGYEYIPIEDYRVAIELESNYEQVYTPFHIQQERISWNDSIFT